MLLLLLAACTYEGDDAGECADGADNDRNGYFDCDDHGCMGSPDCDGTPSGGGGAGSGGGGDTGDGTGGGSGSGGGSGGGGGGTGGGSGSGGGGGTIDTADSEPVDTGDSAPVDTADSGADPLLAALTTYEVEMSLNWVFPSGGFDDCEVTYSGSGDQVDVDSDRVSFYGAYSQTENTCDTMLDAYQPWSPSTGEAYVSFRFIESDTQIDEFYADDSELDTCLRAGWCMYDMATDYDADAMFADHSEVYTADDGSFSVAYVVKIYFN